MTIIKDVTYPAGLFCQLYVQLSTMKDGLNVASLPSPVERYTLDFKLGSGIFGQVFKASDSQAAGKPVAIKVQAYTDENEPHIQEEYKILRDFSKHPNLIDFYGVFCDKSESVRNIWFVLEVGTDFRVVISDCCIGNYCLLFISVMRMWVRHRYCQKAKCS